MDKKLILSPFKFASFSINDKLKKKLEKGENMVSSHMTKTKIAESFKTLFVTQPFDKISVSLIMETAGIRRQTFYNHFGDKYELMQWIFQTDLNEQITDSSECISGFQLLVELLQFFNINQSFYGQLFQVVDQNDFSSYFDIYCQQVIKKIIQDYRCLPFNNVDEEMLFVAYHSLALSNIIKKQMVCDRLSSQLDAKFLINLIQQSLESY